MFQRVSFRFIPPLALALAAGRAGAADGEPAQPARLAAVMAVALEAHPDLRADRARVEAARARTRLAGRLPEPMLKSEVWGVPLRRPLALGDSNAVMVGVSQSLPAPGSLGARERAAAQEAAGMLALRSNRRRDLRAQVRRAFAEYYRVDRELVLHREHLELTARLVELARGSYRAGRRAQQDVLRLALEQSRFHRDLTHIEQERISALAQLNALMNRPAESPLGVPEEIAPAGEPPALATGEAETRRGEMVAARAELARSEAALELARQEGRWPSLTIGADYMYMPGMADRHGFGAMVMMNLPWLSGARGDATQAAEQAVIAERHALESTRNQLRFEVRDARARFSAARATLDIIDDDLLPLARRNFETAEATFGAGQGDAMALVDALRSYLDMRLDRVRSLVHLESAAADLERALASGSGEDRS